MNKNLKKSLTVVMLGVMSYVLMLFSFPIIPGAGYLQLDFSDIPILLALFVFGIKESLAVAGFRSILHFLLLGPDIARLIGDTTAFIATVVFIIPLYFLQRKSSDTLSLKYTVLGLALGTGLMTIILSIANAWVITPLYMQVLGMKLDQSISQMILFGILPFNLVKGVLISFVFVLVVSKLFPWIEKQRIQAHK